MKKKIISLLLALAVVFTMVPAAFAADPTEVADFNALKTAVAAGGSIKLTADITASETITIADGAETELDLNGHTITATDPKTSGNFELFYILGKLAVKDTVGGGGVTLTATTNRAWDGLSAIFHNRGGIIEIYGGTFQHLGGTDMAFVIDNSANHYGDAVARVSGGKLESTYTAIRNFMHPGATTELYVSGTAEVDGATSAIWGQAPSGDSGQKNIIEISGGKVGAVNTARTAKAESKLTITAGEVSDIKAEAAEVSISGGTITGALNLLTETGAPVASASVVSGGTFTNFDPTPYLAAGTGSSDAPSAVTTPGGDVVVHVHALAKKDAVPADCKNDGTIEYYNCDECAALGIYYADANGSATLTAAELVAPATGHTSKTEWDMDAAAHWHRCADCGEICTEFGAHFEVYKDGRCDDCGWYLAETAGRQNPSTGVGFFAWLRGLFA